MRVRSAVHQVNAPWLAATAGAYAQSAVERGRYLVETIVACGNCHTPKGPQGDLPNMALAGGFVIDEQPFTAIAPNITPDPETGIGKWSEADLIKAVKTMTRPDNTPIIGPMMFYAPLWSQLKDEDAAALAKFFKALPPVKHAVARSDAKWMLGPPPGGAPPGAAK